MLVQEGARSGSGKSPRSHAQRVGQQCHFPSRGSACIRVGRGPRNRYIILLLCFGKEGVDTSNDRVCNQFNTVVAVEDYVISGGNHGRGRRTSSIDPVEGMVHSTQFSRLAGGGKGAHPVEAPRVRHYWPSKSIGLRSIRVGNVHSPASWTIGQGRTVCEEKRKRGLLGGDCKAPMSLP